MYSSQPGYAGKISTVSRVNDSTVTRKVVGELRSLRAQVAGWHGRLGRSVLRCEYGAAEPGRGHAGDGEVCE